MTSKNPVSEKVTRESVTAVFGNKTHTIAFEDITVFHADAKYTTVYHAGGEALIKHSLRDILAVYGDKLLQVNRNALVVRKRLSTYNRHGSFMLRKGYVMVEGHAQPVYTSRRLARTIIAAMEVRLDQVA